MSDDVGHWYFTDADGSRHGPVNLEAIRDMIRRKLLGGTELVWTDSFGPEWKKLATTDVWAKMGCAPPLPASAINDTFIWLLAGAPVLFVLLHQFIDSSQMTQTQHFWLTNIVFLLVNSALVGLDIAMIKRTGNAAPRFCWIFLVPVYIWQRSSKLHLSQAPFIVWMVLSVLRLLAV